MSLEQLTTLLGDQAESLLSHTCKAIDQSDIHLPSGDFVSEHFASSNRSNLVLGSLQTLYGHGRLGHTGYLSILPVDQGIEHSAAASFAPNPSFHLWGVGQFVSQIRPQDSLHCENQSQ